MVAQLDKEYIKESKGSSVRRFLSYLFFEGRPHTTKGQWFNPVVFALLKLLARLPRKKPINKPIFIAGLGRSGTTVLGLVMSLHKDLGYLNEPKAAWCLTDEKTDVLDDYVVGCGQYDLQETDATPLVKQSAQRIFGGYLALIGRRRLLDKYPEHIFRIGYLTSIFPDAKIIFITRSGVDAVSSIEKWSQVKGLEKGDEVEDWWGRNDAKWNNLCEQVLSRPPYREKLSSIDLSALDHINRAALEWVVTMDAGLAAQKVFSDNILTVRYESLLENPTKFFDPIFEFCELENQNNVIDYAQKKIFQQKPRPFPVLDSQVQQLFKETMQELGYSYDLGDQASS